MRPLLLALAAFAAGLLVGLLVRPDSAEVARAPREHERRAPQPESKVAPAVAPAPSAEVLSPEAAALGAPAQGCRIPEGTGRVDGRVVDDRGEPIAGVTIMALPHAHETRPPLRTARRHRGEAGPDDLEATILESVEQELWRRRAERTALTGADGRFVLEGLLDTAYSVRAYARGWLIHQPPGFNSGSVYAGATVDFIGRPVCPVEVTVLKPDGGAAVGAMVWRQHGGGRGGMFWTPDRPEIDLPADGKTYTLWAEMGEGPDGLRSQGVDVVAERGAALPPVVLQLAPRASLTVRVVMPDGLLPDRILVLARPLAEGERPDPARLVRDLLPDFRPPSGGDMRTWVDVEPGRYHIGAAWPGGGDAALAVERVIEVHGGREEHELRWPEPDASETRIVRVTDPAGGALQDGVRVQRHSVAGRRRQNRGAPVLPRADGSLLVHLADPEFAEMREGEHWLAVTHPTYGSVTTPLDLRGGAPLAVRFADPIRVAFTIEGWGATGLEGRASLEVRPRDEASWRSRGLPFDARGELTAGPLQPGPYRITLSMRGEGYPDFPLHEQERELSAETERITLVIPKLHDLRVYCPKLAKGTRLAVRLLDSPYPAVLSCTVGDDHVAVVEHLPAGRYSVRGGSATATVEVPAQGEVTLE